MDIEGTYTLQAPPEEVWQDLMNLSTIQQAIPGLERLAQIDEHTYSFTLQIRYAPLRGTYVGQATVLEQNYPAAYQLKIEGEGQSSPFRSVFNIHLSKHDANTVVGYQGTIQLGTHTRISAPMVKATIKMLLQQFFTALTDQIRTERESPVYVTTLEEMYEMPFMEEQLSENLQVRYQERPMDLLHRLVHRLNLGRDNPMLEDVWAQRLRQIGFITLFLLLVWLGTRLPRRLSAIRS